jgi:hypothetical protein
MAKLVQSVGALLPYYCYVICADLMDDKSQKGKEKDVSASAPPHRPKASISATL